MGIFTISAHFTLLSHSTQNMIISAAFEVALFITVLELRDVNILS